MGCWYWGQSCHRNRGHCDPESLKWKDQNLQLSRKLKREKTATLTNFIPKAVTYGLENKALPSELTIWGIFPANSCHIVISTQHRKFWIVKCSWNAGRWREYTGHLVCLLAQSRLIFSGGAEFLSGSRLPSGGPKQSLPLQRARLKQASRIAGLF